MNNEDIKIERERPYCPHHMLLGTAREALEIAENNRAGEFYTALTVITMSALAIEALCNAIGERVVTGWEDFENSSPKAKLRIICDVLNIVYEIENEPWSSIVWLSRVRNKLAHAKPKLLNEKYRVSREDYEKNHDFKPESELEKTMTLVNAKRAYKRVMELKHLLCEPIPAQQAFGLYADMWSGTSSA